MSLFQDLRGGRFYLGDCLEVMKEIPDGVIDCLITDIPYDGVNRPNSGLRNLDKSTADIMTIDINKLMNELLRITCGSGYIFCAWWQLSELVNIVRAATLSCRVIVWEKTNPSPMNGQNIWLSGIELAVYFKKKTRHIISTAKMWSFANQLPSLKYIPHRSQYSYSSNL